MLFARMFFVLFFLTTVVFAFTSEVVVFPSDKIQGEGPFPYNYRIIDDHIHAGGHPLNPKNNLRNNDEQALHILKYLKSKGVETIIDLDNTSSIYFRYKRLLREAGLECFFVPMNADKTPNKEEWLDIKEAMKDPVYLHCKWGADRTGAIIARYLVEVRGYSPKQAFEAVITGGTHAGTLGGLKAEKYQKLVKFFWPDYSPKLLSRK
ncbi:hypothetical protein A3J90_03720 [candidate division WOR-1 bacterium RIFOXYC2_FULL_37_10]|uniref:Tyrosine specific protein phosphatases domain-containing protein n=1 Tax=candidate division WOR-1 bacterium RIFOXYB2_FULL_37_13 TaxID=1802579 RepID=A0A1F4SED4_UNCSA|nr:MAG: hypothetical protein A2246_05265 [candidate division WOR-1 bacterium RIFOXYA2_FULL_37_7]OGC18769.1 MAG: hypothetical protein A2310_02650 [candidate division WOR-1 bacterium RIFOXYB2_FULL_37_13]OGC32670.1 MAG: hypothetical protein A3J90_03720 [candidate division WOR-1 bacterium RIFOXYC2_FULL_37_10]